MLRSSLLAVAFLAVAAFAQQTEGIQKGKIKKIDADKGVIVLTSGDKDIEATVGADTKFMGATDKPLADKLKDKALKEGLMVLFRVKMSDGKTVLDGIKIQGANAGAAQKQKQPQPPPEK